MMPSSPADYNLPHAEYRQHQLESIHWCEGVESGTAIVEAPTGSGKTSYAKAVAQSQSVVTLVRHKSLQVTNYQNTYKAEVLFGRANYACAHPDNHGASCADCLYELEMHKCTSANRCGYLIAKAVAKASPFVSLNYPYWMTSNWRKQTPPQVLFLDEAHNLDAIVTDWVGCTITEKDRVGWNLPDFPTISGRRPNVFFSSEIATDPADAAIDWLRKVWSAANQACKVLKGAGDKKRLRKAEQLRMKAEITGQALKVHSDDWYIRSGPSALKFGRDTRPGFCAKPLTAKYHFPGYFLDGYTTIAMSATLGDIPTFAQSLGIVEYESRVVPSRFPPEARQVHALDVPSMGYTSTKKHPEYWDRQADAIATAIKGCPRMWSGLVHVTRKSEAKLLADRLAHRGLQDRIWVMPGWDGAYTPTDEQVKAWSARKRKVLGSICVSWALWEGYDGLDERIDIVAKTPYPYLGDDYEKARMAYSGKLFHWRTACQMEQGLGRTRRGYDDDYGEENGYVAIADGSWSRVRKYMSAALQSAIVEGK